MALFNFEIEQEKIDQFAQLLEKSGDIKKGVLMSAVVTRKDDSYIFVDVGIKSEGRIPKEEFSTGSIDDVLPSVGDNITVFLEAFEDKNGDVALSYSKALREAGWGKLEGFFHKRATVPGTVVRKVQGGCIVNLSGVSAFLPKSHFPTDIKDMKELFGKQHDCFIIKMDRAKSNIVVSIKNTVSQEDTNSNFAEGQIVEGVVKSINESAAFVDLGGASGRLHISEISWNKIKDPNEVLKVGEKIKVKIIAMPQSNRISLSLKELKENPWVKNVKAAKIEVGKIFDAKIKNIEENSAFLEIDDKVEVKLKATEVAWIKRYQTFADMKKGQVIKVKVIDIDEKKNKIFVSLKHVSPNPVEEFAKTQKIGDEIPCEIMQISDLGYVAQIGEKLDGIIPKNAIYVSGSLKIGEKLNVYVWNISVENGHIILSTKKPTNIS